jgi:hypothetical protein
MSRCSGQPPAGGAAKNLSHLGRWDGKFSRPTFFEAGGTEIPAPRPTFFEQGRNFLRRFHGTFFTSLKASYDTYSPQRSAYNSVLHDWPQCPVVPALSASEPEGHIDVTAAHWHLRLEASRFWLLPPPQRA